MAKAKPTKTKPRGPTGSPNRRRDAARRRAADVDETPKLDIPLPKDDAIGSLSYWTNEVDQAVRRRKKEIEGWRRNLDRAYRGARDKFYGLRSDETIIVPTDFYNVEQKKGQLFFKTPYVQLTAERKETEQAAPLYQHVLNYLLGPKEANVKRTVSEALIDVLCASGIGPTEIGYECQRVNVPMPTNRMEPVIDPLTGQPAVEPDPAVPGGMRPVQQLALDPKTGEPETEDVEKTVWERYYWDRFSPAKLLMPVGLSTTQYDKAPWMGREFDLDAEQINDKWHISMGSIADYPDDQSLASSKDKEFMRSTGRGVVIYYRAHVYDSTEHPERYRKLVLVAGKRKDYVAVVHEDLEYQQFDEHTLRFVGGMKGNPIHPLTIRIVSDSSYPPSDCSIARPTADELSIGRSQMIKQRTRNIPVRGFNRNAVPKDVIARFERGDWQAMIPFDRPITKNDFFEVVSASFPQENFGFDNIIRRDLELIWGFGANQVGGSTDTVRTAEEAKIVEGNKNIRIDDDRNAVLEWFIAGVEKFSALPQIYGDHERLVEIEGMDGAARIQTWDKRTIQGRYGFTLRPDSAVRLNAAEERELQLRFNNLTANNPYFNQLENAKNLARAFNQDPAKVTQQPPGPPPEKPKISVSIKGDDLIPFAPQYPNILVILQGGDPSTMTPPEQPPAPVPGVANPVKAATPAPVVDKHDANLTGKLPGPGPM